MGTDCFALGPAKRFPSPAATMMAVFIYELLDLFDDRRLAKLARGLAKPERAGIMHSECRITPGRCHCFIFEQPAKDHLARRRLEHARHRDVGCLAYEATGVVNDHHRTVIEIRDALIVFLAFFEDKDTHDL